MSNTLASTVRNEANNRVENQTKPIALYRVMVLRVRSRVEDELVVRRVGRLGVRRQNAIQEVGDRLLRD
jgi:hypothetical protein